MFAYRCSGRVSQDIKGKVFKYCKGRDKLYFVEYIIVHDEKPNVDEQVIRMHSFLLFFLT